MTEPTFDSKLEEDVDVKLYILLLKVKHIFCSGEIFEIHEQ